MMEGVETRSNPRWHLIYTKPRSEETAKLNMERQGYLVYFPRLLEKVFLRNGLRERIGALFPRYMFVRLDPVTQSLAPIRSTLGVTNIVRFGTEFTSIADEVVSGLKSREDAAGLHRLANSHLKLKSGSIVKVIAGALAGLEGIFEREDPNDRVVVLLQLLGCETRIRLPMTNIVPFATS